MDGITIEDVEEIAKACIELKWNVVAVDPGPFTSKLAYYRNLIQEEEPNIPPEADETGKTVLIAAGSATPVTKKQMEVLCQDPRHVRVSVDPGQPDRGRRHRSGRSGEGSGQSGGASEQRGPAQGHPL